METPDRNKPELLMARALQWLTLLADFAEIEPEDTAINITMRGADGASRPVAKVTLAEDIAAIQALVGKPPVSINDFDSVEAVHHD